MASRPKIEIKFQAVGAEYLRKTIDGVPVIDGPNGRWPEGDKNHPWEAEAIAAEKQ